MNTEKKKKQTPPNFNKIMLTTISKYLFQN